MEGAVLGEQDHTAVLAFGRYAIAEAIREALRVRPDGGVARDVLRLKPEPALADEAVSLALDEHRLPESVQFRVLVLPTEVPAFHQRVPDHGPGRQRREGGACFSRPVPPVIRL